MVFHGRANGRYRGPDRRGRNDGLRVPVAPSHVVVLTLAVSVGAGVPALFLIPRHPSAATVGTYGAIAASLLLVAAGCTRLVAWRVAGRAVLGWLGSAFVVLGIIILVSDGLSGLGVAPAMAVRPADSFVGSAVAGWLIWRGLTDAEVNAALSPLATLCWSGATGLLLMGLLNAAKVNELLPAWVTGNATSIALYSVSACIWAGAGLYGWRARARAAAAMTPWGAVVAGLLMLGFAARAFSPLSSLSTLASSACLFTGAALALAACIIRLQEILKSGDRAQRKLQIALITSLHQAANDRRGVEEWLHDVRNAVAGLQAADAVLRDELHADIRDRLALADAVTAELARLHALVDPVSQINISDIDLIGTLEPIVAAERALGADIDLALGPRAVRADGRALGRVVQNLLANARRYAPAAPVVITSTQVAGRVEISVRDHGPGMACTELAVAFERGVRGSEGAQAAGNGLGLYVARTLMRAMGGDIWAEHPGDGPGCRVVLSLPSSDLMLHRTHEPASWPPGRTRLHSVV